MDNPSHRRDFVRTLALGASAAALTSPALAGADAPPFVGPPKPKPEPKAGPSEVEARMSLVTSRFGTLLDEGRRKAVEARVAAIVRRAEALRKFELDNGDGPFPVFTPYRAPLSGGEGPPK
jgi:hypothetical protein